jgi:hypothetical protein
MYVLKNIISYIMDIVSETFLGTRSTEFLTTIPIQKHILFGELMFLCESLTEIKRKKKDILIS